MARKRPDHLEPWMIWLRDALAARGKPARVAYDDKVAGDVLLLAVDGGERDRVVEITVTRRPKGAAHIAALATTRDGATAVHEAMARMHTDVSRLANAKRKFIHRIERVLSHLTSEWPTRSSLPPDLHTALDRLRATFPEAVPMTGVGFHVDLASADDHHTRDAYPTLHGAAVLLDGRWRALPWDPGARLFMMRAGTMAAISTSRPSTSFDAAGIGLWGAAAMGAAAAAAIASGAVPLPPDIQSSSTKQRTCDWADSFDPCDVLECTFDLADLGNCVPDCSAIDCGAVDCSL